jgi:hypothetical protein
MSNRKLSVTEKWILAIEIILAIAGVVITISSRYLSGDWKFLSYIGIPCAIISISMLLIAFQIKEKYIHIQEDLQVADSLYKKRSEYLTLGELNDIEQKFGKNGNIEIYIASNDLSTETKDWKEIIEKNLLNNVKYFYLTNENNKEHFNGIFKDLKEKRKFKKKRLQDNFSISLNNCLFKFLPKFSEIIIYRDNNKSPVEMRCFVSYTNKGEKELYKETDSDFSGTIWKLIDDCIKNTQDNHCSDCTYPLRCKKHIPQYA